MSQLPLRLFLLVKIRLLRWFYLTERDPQLIDLLLVVSLYVCYSAGPGFCERLMPPSLYQEWGPFILSEKRWILMLVILRATSFSFRLFCNVLQLNAPGGQEERQAIALRRIERLSIEAATSIARPQRRGGRARL